MSLQNASILVGATVTASGGTAKTLTTDGKDIPNGLHLIDASVADKRERPTVTVSSKFAKLLASGRFGKESRTLTAVFPYVDEDGLQQFPLWRIQQEVLPDMSAATTLEMKLQVCQMIMGDDFALFWSTGSLG